MSVRNGFLSLVAACLTCTGVANAQSGPGDPDDDRLRGVLERMDAMERENAELRREVDELRAVTGDEWLTERRADEIRSLVGDILLDADLRTSLVDGMTAGWSDHFFLASPDGRFKLQLEGQIQVLAAMQFQEVEDRWRRGFENTRTKIVFRGHVFDPAWEYLIRGGFRREVIDGPSTFGGSAIIGGEMILEDAWIRHRVDDNWSVRAGQFKLPFNREELVSSAHQQAVERSLFNEGSNLGRSQGIEVTYAGDRQKFMFAYSEGAQDQLGGFGSIIGTRPPHTPAIFTDSVEYAFTLRYEHLCAGTWSQFADFTSQDGEPYGVLFGIAGHYQMDEAGTGIGPFPFSPPIDDQNESAAWTVDLSIEWGGANAFAAFTHHYSDNTTFGVFQLFGIVVQGGVYISPKWELFARYEYAAWDEPGTIRLEDLNLLTVGAVYYIDGHDLKWTTDIGYAFNRIDGSWDSNIAQWRSLPADTDQQVVLRTQLQLLF